MTTTKLYLCLLAIIALIGTGVYLGRSGANDPDRTSTSEMAKQERAIALLRNENESLKAKNAQFTAAVSDASASSQATSLVTPRGGPQSPATAFEQKKQAVFDNLRRIEDAWAQYRLVNNRPPESMADLVGPGKLIAELTPVDGEDYSSALLVGGGGMLTVTTANGMSVTYGPGARESVTMLPPGAVQLMKAHRAIGPAVAQAMEAYRAAHKGHFPKTMDEVVPYFADPKVAKDYLEWREAEKAVFTSAAK